MALNGHIPSVDEFIPREYQTELLEIAIERNAIVFLPTGSGKTFIASMLIKRLGKPIEPSYTKGGKRTFFLVNSVALVGQQAECVRRQTPFKVGEYSGDSGVDFWDEEKWKSELDDNQVLVMTVQVLLDMLQHNYVRFDKINLLILDECHHATNNHPMKKVMDFYKLLPAEQRPRVLGLTATLLNSNCRPNQVKNEKSALEQTLDAKIAFTKNRELLARYSTKPVERLVQYPKTNHSSRITELVLSNLDVEFKKWTDSLDQVLLISDLDEYIKLENGAVRYSTQLSSRKKIKNLLKNVKDIGADLGIYGANKAILSLIITLERVRKSLEDRNLDLMVAALVTDLHRLRGGIEKIMEKECPSGNHILYFATPKLRKLLDTFKEQNKNDLSIVFVELRLTAKVLYYVLSDLSMMSDDFAHLHPDFMTGFANNPYKESREGLYDKKQNMLALYRFNHKQTNVLVASDVIEEGIDVRLCNYVIKFDLPKTVRSYIQSKGRARHECSRYLLFVCEDNDKFIASYNSFVAVEDQLKNALDFEDYDCEGAADENELAKHKPYDPYPPDGAKLLPVSAISLLNRYCSTLPQDSFSRLTVDWFLKKLPDGKFEIYLTLPLDSAVKGLIKGPPAMSKINAKHLAAFEACKLLHKAGELDTRLMPRGSDSAHLDDSNLFPHWRQSEHKTDSGTKKSKRRYDKEVPDCLFKCLPTEGEPVYVHILMIKPNFLEPIDCARDSAFFNILKSNQHFALLSSKPIPSVCKFPLFMKVGEVTVDVKVNYMKIHLFNNLLDLLSDFHTFIFDKLLRLNSGKHFLIRDNENKEYPFLISPCIYDDKTDKFEIDWEVIHSRESLLVPVVEPKDRTLNVTNDSHLMKVVEPWYRGNLTENYRYIVTEVSLDETPMTEFPSRNFDSYYTYYQSRHKQTVHDTNQPLIEVRAISNKLNFLNPRQIAGVSKKRVMDDEIFNEKFIPELCVVHNIPSAYALKSTLLPSLLHRLTQLLVAEELRQRIAVETGLHDQVLPLGQTWMPLTVEKASLATNDGEGQSLQSTIDVTNLLQSRMEALTVNDYPWRPQDEPFDIDRFIDRVDALAITHYESFLKAPTVSLFSKTKAEKRVKKVLMDPPPLKVLQNKSNPCLPELKDILMALTSKSSADIVNYERTETLGDSFLKFAVSLALFMAFPNDDEGKLTTIKGKLIGNRNLFYCGDAKAKLGMKIKINEFNVNDWDIPRFTIPRPLKSLISDLRVSPSILYELRTTEEERRTGILKNSTIVDFNKKVSDAIDQNGENGSISDLMGHQTVADKVVADCVEALLGVYVLAHGIEGGLKMCRWFGILPAELASYKYLIELPAPSPLFQVNDSSMRCLNPDDHINEPDELEYILGYKFKDRAFLLQALTHSSYTRGVTNCYQRLEFLGDAVLDFLITNHIYESCGKLTPGELTDLRSALVNNVTFACLAVRHRFHTFLNSRACQLNEIVNKFVEHQISRKHAVGPEILFLLEENDVNSVSVASIVDVPKCLGDVFESLAGAIYLDSGKDLNVVWRVFYNLMHHEIKKFSQNVPKNMIRLLFEKFPNPLPKFSHSKVIPDNKKVMVGLEINHNNETFSFFGVGNNKREAKLAAAKLALRKFHSRDI